GYLYRRLGGRLMVYGHSAGGHLAACMLATNWPQVAPDLPDDLVPSACAISGVFDLNPLVGLAMNEDLRLDSTEAHRQSPLFWPPPQGRSLDIVVGGQESGEFLRQSRTLADTWGGAGVTTHLEETVAANHFTVIDPLMVSESRFSRR